MFYTSLGYQEFCDGFIHSIIDTRDLLFINSRVYNIGDVVIIEAYQDLDDPLYPHSFILGISIDDETSDFDVFEIIPLTQSYSENIILEIELDDKFKAGSRYAISTTFATTDDITDDSFNLVKFFIVPDNQTQPPPPPTSEPEPPLSGTVFRDSNGDGQQNRGESAIPNATVIWVDLSDFSNTGTTLTNSSGMYKFDIPAGRYLIQVQDTTSFAYLTIPAGQTITQDFAVPP